MNELVNDDNTEMENLAPLTLDYADSANIYDLVPYMGRSYSSTHPENLYCLARLSGINAAPMEKMRVMEIGSAIGGNILPIAARYPKAEFVGIEPAEKQMKMAEKRAKRYGIKNCTFHNVAADGIDPKLGKFDYIICHGVFSWITDEARESITNACKNHLAENGIAIISYNCKPGWNFLSAVRDVALFHTRNIRDPQLRIQQARQAIHFVSDNAGGNKIYADYFKSHAEKLHERADYYLFHDHLEPNNRALYFVEFMDIAHKYDLQYIRETNDNYDNDLSFFKPEARQFMMTVQDRVMRAQYADYLMSRQFRSTMLALKDLKPDVEIAKAAVNELYYRAGYRIEEKQDDLGNKITHVTGGSFGFDLNEPRMESLLRTLLGHEEIALNIKEWVAETKNKFPDTTADEKELTEFLLSQIQALVLKGFIKACPTKPDAINRIEDKPKIFGFVRNLTSQIEASHATNYFGDSLPTLPKQVRLILPLLDGTNDHKALGEVLKKAILAGELLLPDKFTAEALGQYQEGMEIPRYSQLEKVSVINRMSEDQLNDITSQVLQTTLRTLQAQSLLVRN